MFARPSLELFSRGRGEQAGSPGPITHVRSRRPLGWRAASGLIPRSGWVSRCAPGRRTRGHPRSRPRAHESCDDRRAGSLGARRSPVRVHAPSPSRGRREGRVPRLEASSILAARSGGARAGTKGRNAAWIPVDEDLQRWIEWRLVRVSKEEMLRQRIALFPNPTARNREKRWIANTLREEGNQAAAKVGVRVRMYEGTKHSSATAWLAQGR